MTNTTLLKERIHESGYRIYFLAEKCGITYQGFSNKVNGLSEFTASEIAVLKDLLRLNLKETESIFFTKK